MTHFISGIRAIRDAIGATVLVVHHTGHENLQRGRGSSALKAAVDTEIQVARSEVDEDLIGVTVRKQRNGEIWSQPKGFRFESSGESCVLVPTDEIPELGAKVQTGLGKNQTALIEAIVPYANDTYPNELNWPFIGLIALATAAKGAGISNKRRSEVVSGLLKRRLLTSTVGGYLISPTLCQ